MPRLGKVAGAARLPVFVAHDEAIAPRVLGHPPTLRCRTEGIESRASAVTAGDDIDGEAFLSVMPQAMAMLTAWDCAASPNAARV